jgi:hypothetical protein
MAAKLSQVVKVDVGVAAQPWRRRTLREPSLHRHHARGDRAARTCGVAAARLVLNRLVTMRRLAVLFVLVATVGIAGAAGRGAAVSVTAACASTLRLDAAARKAHAAAIRTALVDALARRDDASPVAIDVSLVALDLHTVRGHVEITAKVHAMVSDDQRRIVWLGTTGARVEIPVASYRADQLTAYQREAIDAAISDLVRSLRAELRQHSTDRVALR